jgi:hypothetical protein
MKGCGRVEVKLHLLLTANTRWRGVAIFVTRSVIFFLSTACSTH